MKPKKAIPGDNNARTLDILKQDSK